MIIDFIQQTFFWLNFNRNKWWWLFLNHWIALRWLFLNDDSNTVITAELDQRQEMLRLVGGSLVAEPLHLISRAVASGLEVTWWSLQWRVRTSACPSAAPRAVGSWRSAGRSRWWTSQRSRSRRVNCRRRERETEQSVEKHLLKVWETWFNCDIGEEQPQLS